MRAIRRFTVRSVLPEPLAPLEELAFNLRWSWHPETLELFASVDPALWEATGRDPVRLLGAVSAERLQALIADAAFMRRLGDLVDDLREYVSGNRWYQSLPDPAACVAYFSPEYGIAAALPQYSGGLGILAGDHLKAASDLGVPILGVGLLYRHGYFSQSLSPDGWQLERYPVVDPAELPLSLLREADGSPVHIDVALPEGGNLRAQLWVAQVGRVPLLLLDSDVESNDPAARDVTDRLYGGGSEHRLLQEMLLGIGGVRAIRAYCRITGHPAPEVFHTNEGHAGFLGVERIAEFVASGLTFAEAQDATRAGTVFTTHTPVPAGIDRFARPLIERFFAPEAERSHLRLEDILDMGAETYDGGDLTVFNMAVMGMRLAQRVNGVSELHGEVSREMFGGLWGGFDTSEVPIGFITNGVHASTWVAPEIVEVTRKDTAELEASEAWKVLEGLPDADIWQVRGRLRRRLVLAARERLRESWRARGASEAELTWIDEALDENICTMGFARRVPSYKRLTLMLQDSDRLKRALLHPERPVQIIIAGKAHPADEGGKRLIQDIVRFCDDPEVRHRIVFLPDYDMTLGQQLTEGCDVWMNNPLRPLEACGTSGMKAALNGGLNLSIRDGWWDEWYDGTNGWAIPSADSNAPLDEERRDTLEAAAMYELIEDHVSALFYDRSTDGLPRRWLEMVKHTLSSLGPKVQADRMVRDYVNSLYTPAAKSARRLVADDYAGARSLARWKTHVAKGWPLVDVEHVESEGDGQTPLLGSTLQVRATVGLDGLTTTDVAVEVAYGRVDDNDTIIHPSYVELTPGEDLGDGRIRYVGEVPLDKTGPFGYSVRVVPHNDLLDNRAELGLIAVPPAPVGMTNGDLR